MKEVLKCPLCDWQYELKPLHPDVGPDTLASVFGPGIMLQTALNQRTQDTERALEEHFKKHTTAEWLQKVSSLQWELDRLKETFI